MSSLESIQASSIHEQGAAKIGQWGSDNARFDGLQRVGKLLARQIALARVVRPSPE